eukprot:TRINITY_DN19356_c0_g2_i1.p1 TRINITY_DN19356_c0_g2~~TRINITY_DN19356_c0_g2_i1.p1  ORF type:complete len:441 (+),score=68.88 TRINITY_DN19356_c0_g2_i1:232-1554(+)
MGCASSDLVDDMLDAADKSCADRFSRSWELIADEELEEPWELTLNQDGLNVLQLACRSGSALIVAMVLERSEELEPYARAALLRAGEADHTAPMLLAAAAGHTQVVQLLLEAGLMPTNTMCEVLECDQGKSQRDCRDLLVDRLGTCAQESDCSLENCTESSMSSSMFTLTLEKLHALAAEHSWFPNSGSDLSGTNSWGGLQGKDFRIRGPAYLQDRKKVRSSGCLMPVVCVEILPGGPEALSNVSSHPNGFVQKVARADWGEAGVPFLFCISFHVPCSSPGNFMFNIFCVQDPGLHNSPGSRVLKNFISASGEVQRKKFKLIPRVAVGSWLVKKACGDPPRPAVMGSKVKQTCHNGDGYFEVDLDLSTSAVVGSIVTVVLGPCKSLVVDLGFLVEAQTQAELPEHLLCALRMLRVDLSSAINHVNPYLIPANTSNQTLAS